MTCVECVAEFLEGRRTEDEINWSEGNCTECDRGACVTHGSNYGGDWQHDTCHEITKGATWLDMPGEKDEVK